MADRIPRLAPRLEPDVDARLVGRCLSGEARAWEALVRRHERLVYAITRRWRLSDEDAADVFQEVFAALVRGLPRLRDGRTLVRWLASTSERIARATSLRSRRELARVAGGTALEDQPDSGPEAAAALEALEEQALVRLALDSLGERCRKLLQALYYEDPTPAYAELSRRLGMPIGSLGPTRARCFERLRESFERSRVAGISTPASPTFSREPENRVEKPS